MHKQGILSGFWPTRTRLARACPPTSEHARFTHALVSKRHVMGVTTQEPGFPVIDDSPSFGMTGEDFSFRAVSVSNSPVLVECTLQRL